jgi:hypothetical protein
MSDPAAALTEIARLVKPGGRLGLAIWYQSPFGLFRDVVANMSIPSDAPQPSGFGREPDEFASALREMGFVSVEVQQRKLVSVLEGGIPQALEVAVASSAGAMMSALESGRQEELRAALIARLEPLVVDGAVHLTSVANIASARRPK